MIMLIYHWFLPESEESIPVYYIFNVNQDDGFVIIAADDDVYPF